MAEVKFGRGCQERADSPAAQVTVAEVKFGRGCHGIAGNLPAARVTVADVTVGRGCHGKAGKSKPVRHPGHVADLTVGRDSHGVARQVTELIVANRATLSTPNRSDCEVKKWDNSLCQES